MQLKLDAVEKVRTDEKRQKDAECRLSLNAGKTFPRESRNAGKSKECNANLVTGWYPGRIYTTFIKTKRAKRTARKAQKIQDSAKFTAEWQALFIDDKDKDQRKEDRVRQREAVRAIRIQKLHARVRAAEKELAKAAKLPRSRSDRRDTER